MIDKVARDECITQNGARGGRRKNPGQKVVPTGIEADNTAVSLGSDHSRPMVDTTGRRNGRCKFSEGCSDEEIGDGDSEAEELLAT